MTLGQLQNLEDKDLIEGCLKNDRLYQEALYRKFADTMYRVAWTYAKDDDEAADILQDGFINCFRNLHRYKFEGSFEGWIRRIIVNKALEYYRSKRRKEEVTREYYERQEHSTDDLLSGIQARELIGMVNHLPDKAAMVLKLYAIEGYAHREIADLMGISEGTSKSQLNRARGLLRDRIEKLNG
tara:strand:- start:30 stop:581 length:552 start_codon:yes stop_codon:yes gene_type:complete